MGLAHRRALIAQSTYAKSFAELNTHRMFPLGESNIASGPPLGKPYGPGSSMIGGWVSAGRAVSAVVGDGTAVLGAGLRVASL